MLKRCILQRALFEVNEKKESLPSNISSNPKLSLLYYRMFNDLNESSVPPAEKNWVWILRTRVIEFKDEANKNGVGYITDKNGNTYRGDWENNKREGKFIYI